MSASSVDYGSIQISWNQPSGTIFRYRLLTSRWGFPVNENDGTVLIDSPAYPGSAYLHQQIVPGVMYYYGLYVLVDVADNIWVRSGVTACLAVKNFSSGDWLENCLPQFFKTLPHGGELDGPNSSPDSYLTQFLRVLGWGFDYVRTQYALLANHLNDPGHMPVDDLFSLAATLGLNLSPATDPYVVRKAVQNSMTVARERGTDTGLDNEITLHTGYSADIQPGANLMLDDDQGELLNPVYPVYSPYRAYRSGDRVLAGASPDGFSFGGHGYWYQCAVATSLGVAPPGDGTNNANWTAIRDADGTLSEITNPATGNPSTWEILTPTGTQITAVRGRGVQVPGASSGWSAWNSLRLKNTGASAETMWARSVSRTTAQGTISLNPVPLQAVSDGVPVPWVRPSETWDPAIRYSTGDLVLWQGQTFMALRASTGAEPPDLNTATPEWAPLGFDNRVRLMLSGYASQDLSVGTDEAVPVTPFVEWYDKDGHFITRVLARNPLGDGTVARPDVLTYDSFTTPSSEFEGVVNIGPWSAEYYNNTALQGNPVLSRTDNALDFEWDSTSPGPGVNATGWSSRWRASFTAPTTGTYTFKVSSSDGSRVYVNGEQIIDNWETQPTTAATGTIDLNANTTASVEVDYFKAAEPPAPWDITVTTFDDLKFHGWFGGEPLGHTWDPGLPATVRGNQATTKDGLTLPVTPIPDPLTDGTATSTVDGVTIEWPETHAILFGGAESLTGHNNPNVAKPYEIRTFYGPMVPVTPGTNVVAGAWTVDRGRGVTPFIQWVGKPGTPVDYSLLPDSTAQIPGTLGVTQGDTSPPGAPGGGSQTGNDPIKWVLASVSGVAPPGAKYAMLLIREWYAPQDNAPDISGIHPLIGPNFFATQALPNYLPSGITLDPITWTAPGDAATINGRITDDRQNSWTTTVGDFVQSSYLGGTVIPADVAQRCLALTQGQANGNVGVTFRSAPPDGTDQGLIFRYSDDNNYWRAGRVALVQKSNGNWSSAGTYSTPFSDGDRMVVNLNGSTITVYRNGEQVLQLTNETFNQTATQHGLASEPQVTAGSGAYGEGTYGEGVYG